MSATATNLNNVLTVGRQVQLRLYESDALQSAGLAVDERAAAYASRIEDVLGDALVVAWPTDRGVLIPVAVGQEIKVEIRHESGQYALTSRIMAKSQDTIPVLHVLRAGNWSTAQLRNNVRLRLLIVPTETVLLTSSANARDASDRADTSAGANGQQAGAPAGKPIRATIQDISASGMRIVATAQLTMSDTIQITFPLGKGQNDISTKAKVVWSKEADGPGSGKGRRTEAGCEFVGLSARDQDAIMRFIFSKQAELRRSGLL